MFDYGLIILLLDFREEEARMEELAVLGGFADTKFLSRTLSSQIHLLRARSEIFSISYLRIGDFRIIIFYFIHNAWDVLHAKPLRLVYLRFL